MDIAQTFVLYDNIKKWIYIYIIPQDERYIVDYYYFT